jgi:hypothetical protein
MKKTLLIAVFLGIVLGCASALCCTALCASEGDIVLVGNNEDFANVPTKAWIFPREKGKLGRIYFGFKDIPYIPMGGMNERGLFFDCFSTPPLDVKLSRNKEKYRGFLMTKIMEECGTVKKALEIFSKYNLEYMRTHQTFIVDRGGDWAIVEGDAILRRKSGYQVVTNFYHSQVKDGPITCERYKIAVKMLEQCPRVSIDCIRRILSATHLEWQPYRNEVLNTVYSNIYDLTKGLIYLYHFHDFANEVVINLREELRKGQHSYDIPSLFPKTIAGDRFLDECKKRKATAREIIRGLEEGL